MKLSHQRGFGMIEILVAMALIGAGVFTIMEGLDYIERNKSETDKNVALENTIAGVVESVKSNIIMEKVDFQASTAWLNNSTYEAVKNSLKLCWVKDGMIPLESYPECPGRLGYVVTPMKTGNLELRGLYSVTIRVTHNELFPGVFKQYEFIVRGP